MSNLKYYSEEDQRIIVAAALLWMQSDLHRTALHMGGVDTIQEVDELETSLRQEGDAVDLMDEARGWLDSEEGLEYARADEIGVVHPDPFAGLGDAAKEAFVKFLLALPADYRRAFVVKREQVDGEGYAVVDKNSDEPTPFDTPVEQVIPLSVTLLESGESVRVNIGSLWVNVSRTDEGVVADIFCDLYDESIGSTYAHFSEGEVDGDTSAD